MLDARGIHLLLVPSVPAKFWPYLPSESKQCPSNYRGRSEITVSTKTAKNVSTDQAISRIRHLSSGELGRAELFTMC